MAHSPREAYSRYPESIKKRNSQKLKDMEKKNQIKLGIHQKYEVIAKNEVER